MYTDIVYRLRKRPLSSEPPMHYTRNAGRIRQVGFAIWRRNVRL